MEIIKDFNDPYSIKIILILISGIIILLCYNFTTVQSGNLKFIVNGETWNETLDGDHPEKHLNIFGNYWIGISFLYKLHEFKLPYIFYNEDINFENFDAITKVDVSIVSDTIPKKLFIPVLLKGVELADMTRIDIILYCDITIENSKKFIFENKLNLIIVKNSIASKLNDIIKNISDFNHFTRLDKSRGSEIFKNILHKDAGFCHNLLDYTGLHLTGIYITKYRFSSEFIAAKDEEAIARFKAAAVIARAQGEAAALKEITYAQFENIKQTSQAEIDGILVELENLNVSPDKKIEILSEIVRSKSIERSKIQTILNFK